MKTPGSNTNQEMKEKYHQATEFECLEITQVHFPGESISQKGHEKSWILWNSFMRNLRVHFMNRPNI